MKYVNVAISNNSEMTDNLYTYKCEFPDVKTGYKVCVPFGKSNRIKDAYVFEVMDQLPNDKSIPISADKITDKTTNRSSNKTIDDSTGKTIQISAEKEGENRKESAIQLKSVESIDDKISLNEEMIGTCRWMRDRYLVKYIDGVNCFIPPGKPSANGKKRNPFEGAPGEEQKIEKLTPEQETALETIRKAIISEKREMFLLHGVTGSGKTEVYLQAAGKTLEEGKTSIILVPEISLTKQIIDRFIGRFGAEQIAVLHSKLSLGQRYDEWMRIRSGQVKVVIGARSAVFAPLENIGLIVLDEEHESSYKADMTPKYDTAEVAIKRLNSSNGVLILGSATPSVVTCHRAEEGIFKKLELKKRYNDVMLPEVSIVDMREELRNGNTGIISNNLYNSMKKALENGEQIILFLNRRGYSGFVSCRECGETVRCPECGISLTYHKDRDKLVCHYCGREFTVKDRCPECGSSKIKYFGVGTEQVEEVIRNLFPERKTARLDLDTTRRKGSIEKIIGEFSKGKTDILIGTQLVAKGLDFKNIGLVGIISADVTLNIPDFRAPERTFQLITQAAGRAGRGSRRGKVIIQTYTPENYAIIHASQHDYNAFYTEEIKLRKMMEYPPFSDLFRLVFSSKDESRAFNAGKKWEKKLKLLAVNEGGTVFELKPAPMSKIKNDYRFSLLIKSPLGKRSVYTALIRKLKNEKLAEKKPGYQVGLDINPYSFM